MLVANICTEIVIISLVVSLMVILLKDREEDKTITASFKYLLICCLVHSLSNSFIFLLRAKQILPKLMMFNAVIFNLVGYASCHAMCRLFEVSSVRDKKIRRAVHNYNNIALGVSVIVTLVLLPTGLLYYVDEHCVYYRGKLFPITYVFVILCLLINECLVLKLLEKKNEKVFFSVYMLLPIFGSICTLFLPDGISYIDLSVGVGLPILFSEVYIKKREENLSNKAVLMEYRAKTMMSQIKPHFVYNTLSTIYYLVDKNPQQAKNAIGDFSKFLRTNIELVGENKLVPLERELKHVEHYLNIEKLRYEERLKVTFDIKVNDFFVPPLSVQPIVENAVKHGIGKINGGGNIYIKSYETDDNYVVEIRDSGPGFVPEDVYNTKEHVGIQNVSERIKNLCDGTLIIKSEINIGTDVKMIFPKKKGETNENCGIG